ncbi:MAG: glycosyltransferase family 39 protein, partial [Planctomycetaceae bacterium]
MASAVRSTSAHSAEFADRLSADARPWRAGKSAWALLAGLFAICLIPRLLMAWKLDAACDDAYYYVFVANCLKKGDFVSAFDYLNLNVYPAILLGLHQLGFDWIVGGKIWGAVVGSLTVLPMFGWVRRLFDDRVAGMAGFLYAVHPHLIEVSVEPIREATFWFFLTLSLYFIWRSIDGLRIHDFV